MMMRMLVALFTLATLAKAQVLLQGTCPRVLTMRNFDPNKFLGTWYEIERFYSDYEVNAKCSKMEYSQSADGRYALLNTGIHTRTGRPMVRYGISSFDLGDLSRMSVRLSPRPSDPTPDEFPYWVLDTDYQSFALVYSCEDLCRGHYHSESVWILGRAGALSPSTLNNLYLRLRTFGVDPKRLMRVEQDDCVNVAVSVRSSYPNLEENKFSRSRARNFLASLYSNNKK